MGNLCHSEFNITTTLYNNYLPSKGEPTHAYTHAYTHVRHKHYKMDKSRNIIKLIKTVSNYTHYGTHRDAVTCIYDTYQSKY